MAMKCYMGVSEKVMFNTEDERKDIDITGTYPSFAVNKSGQVICTYNSSHLNSKIHDIFGAVNPSGNSILWKAQNYVCEGDCPQVAFNGNNEVVMVYTQSNRIMYRAGTTSDSTITWDRTEQDLFEGKYPSIAISGKKILIAFQAGSDIRYCFGSISSDKPIKFSWIQTAKTIQIDVSYPSVTMNKEHAVVIYSSRSTLLSQLQTSPNLLTRVGKISSNGVDWNEVQDDTNDTRRLSEFFGYYPSVTMLRGRDPNIIVTFQKGSGLRGHQLHVRCGKISPDYKKIRWHDEKKPAGPFVQGCYSSVAAVNENKFIEMHCSDGLKNKREMWSNVCKLDS